MLVKWQPQSVLDPRDAGGPGAALSLLTSQGHGILLASLRDGVFRGSRDGWSDKRRACFITPGVMGMARGVGTDRQTDGCEERLTQ